MGRSVTFPLERGTARGYLARSAAGFGDGVLVIDPTWRAETEHHAGCDALAAENVTALIVDLADGEVPGLTEVALAVLLEGLDYLEFHPSVRGRRLFVTGDARLVERLRRERSDVSIWGTRP